jgi:glycosyltransferase 2 family protein
MRAAKIRAPWMLISQRLGRAGLYSVSTILLPKRSLAYGAKLLISVGGIWFVFQKYDLLSGLPRLLEHAQGWLAVGLAALILQIAIAAIRWHSILRSLRLPMPIWTVVQIFYVMAFLNSFLPAGLGGDALRVWLLRRNEHGISTAVNSVLIDRLVAVFALLIPAAAVQPLLWLQVENAFLLVAVVGSALSMSAAICAGMFIVPRTHWPIFGRLMPMLHAVSHDLRLVFLDITGLSTTMVSAFASNLLLVGAAFALAYGSGVNVGFLTWLVVMPVVLLVTALPISVGGWGTREIAMVYMLGLFAVPPDLAAAVSIQLGLCMTIASLVGAPVWAMLGQNRARSVPGVVS